MRRTISSLLVLAMAGCTFGFAGGGLPPAIRTVAVMPFDNVTADPTLAQAVNLAVKQAIESRLGLHAAPKDQADALVTGKVTRYEPDEPLQYVGTQSTAGAPNTVNVTRRQVELSVDITVTDQHTGKTLWDGRNQTVQGDYDPGREQDGRKKALDLLVTKVIQGVQQNW
ncbi:MAG TPA: LPS assembly lipoprotein LptE [Gemmatimonadales bacterium]|jgi:hypothetical protein